MQGRTYRPRKLQVEPGRDSYIQAFTCEAQAPVAQPAAGRAAKGQYPSVRCGFGGLVGRVQINNTSPYSLVVSLWHPDSQRIHQSLTIPVYTSNGPSYAVGNDWGIQLGSSSVRCLGQVASFDRLENIFRVGSDSFYRP